jgi:hypothetical protein
LADSLGFYWNCKVSTLYYTTLINRYTTYLGGSTPASIPNEATTLRGLNYINGFIYLVGATELDDYPTLPPTPYIITYPKKANI